MSLRETTLHQLYVVDGYVEKLRQEELLKHGGEPPTGGDEMEARVAKVEAAVEHIQTTLADTKVDIRELRTDISRVRDKIDTNFIITWGGLIAGILGLAWLMAKGFHWL